MTKSVMGMTIIQMHGEEGEVNRAQMRVIDLVNQIRDDDEEFSIISVNINTPTSGDDDGRIREEGT